MIAVDSSSRPEAKEVSAFAKILGNFDREITREDELISSISPTISLMIDFEKRFDDEQQSEQKLEQKLGTLIGEFQTRLDKLHDMNNRLEEILHNLTRLMG